MHAAWIWSQLQAETENYPNGPHSDCGGIVPLPMEESLPGPHGRRDAARIMEASGRKDLTTQDSKPQKCLCGIDRHKGSWDRKQRDIGIGMAKREGIKQPGHFLEPPLMSSTCTMIRGPPGANAFEAGWNVLLPVLW